jgi:DNA invertase Pin-like site-specific DNA recombinase
MERVGYARVSTLDQDPSLQIDALNAAGCRKVFVDYASGAKADRPELANALDYAREGDTLVVWKLDRLGRSLPHLIEVTTALRARGVQFHSLTEGIDTTTAAGELVFHIFGALAQFERALIRERTMAGLKAARARGRRGGRRPSLTPAQRKAVKGLWATREHTYDDLAGMFKVSRSTIARAVREETPA